MNGWTIARRGLWYYRRSNLAVVAGLAISAMTLVGALTVGDSVRYSLDQIARARIGRAVHALLGQDRFFRADLADRLAAETGNATAPVLLFTGHVVLPGGEGRVNNVQVLGVDERFWAMAPGEGASASDRSDRSDLSDLVINDHLAARLGATTGDVAVVRMGAPSDLPGEAFMSGDRDDRVSWRAAVAAVVDDDAFGRFGLQANQVAPYNVFVPLTALQHRTGLGGNANLVLVGAGETMEIAAVRKALQDTWQIEDAALTCIDLPDQGQVELKSRRVFIDPPAAKVALGMDPADHDEQARPVPMVTYLVNALTRGDRSTPYSMVCALPMERWFETMPGPAGPRDMVINTWLAEDLGAARGDAIEAAYFIPGPGGTLIETSAMFRVHAIVAIEGPAADASLMPDFPGLSGAESCRTWEPGFDLDLDRIRDKDEAYWDAYRGTPKAFIPLTTGTNLWHNRFGTFTAVRFPAAHYSAEGIASGIRQALDPASVGLRVEPVRETALAASGQAMSFGGLFLGLSMFLLAAALLLGGMLFAFGSLRRAGETGLRLATGYTPRRVLAAYLREGLLLVLIATAAGTGFGLVYTHLLLRALTTVWQGAVGQTTLLYHAEASSVLAGASVNVLAALATMAAVVRGQVRRPVHELLAGSVARARSARARTRGRAALALAILCALGAVILVAVVLASPGANDAGAFFAAGTLLLVAGIVFCAALLGSSGRAAHPERLSRSRLVLLGLARRRGRSLGAVAMLACGTFMVVGVGAHRPDLRGKADHPRSGTGGFNYIAELSQPITRDLNTPEGRAEYGLDEGMPEGVRFTPLRVHGGDDASCLNLNRAQRPRLLGVDPDAMEGRFTFAGVHPDFKEDEAPWNLLRTKTEDGRVPGIIDQDSLLWALGKKLGDTVAYTDAHGRTFEVVLAASLAGSILQGSILIDERAIPRGVPFVGGLRPDPGRYQRLGRG